MASLTDIDLSMLSINDDNDDHINSFLRIIRSNSYVKNIKPSNTKDKNAISFLVDRNLSQSDKIKLGIAIEKVSKDFILYHNKDLINIKEKNKKDIKEKDHLFKNEKTKTIFYAELKSNLNLDTEKSKQTIQKIKDIEDELIQKYTDYKIVVLLVNMRHLIIDDTPRNVIIKYKDIRSKVVGVNEYLEKLGLNSFQFSINEYTYIINQLVHEMFSTY